MNTWFRKHLIWKLTLIACVFATIYWTVVASDRYVSEARVVVDRSNAMDSSSVDMYTMLLGGGGSQDLLLLREYLQSFDMLKELDKTLSLRDHYSDHRHDLLSRLWFKTASMERFHDYYLRRVSIEYDDYAHVLVIRAQAYSPEMAQSITRMLVQEGERYMNESANKIAGEQVVYIEKQARKLGSRMLEDRQALLAFQNTNGLASARGEVQSLSSVIATAEAELADLNVKRVALKDVYMPQSPAIQQIDAQIVAVQRQIDELRSRMASSKGKSLNRVVEEQDRLQAVADFSQDTYKTALGALERARFDATRKLRTVSVVQSPTFPEYSMEPRRVYNLVLFALAALMLGGAIEMIVGIVRDHRD